MNGILQFPKDYINLGNAYYRLNLPQEAIEAYKQAININPNDTDALNGLSEAYNKLRSSQQSSSESSSTTTSTTHSSDSSNKQEEQDKYTIRILVFIILGVLGIGVIYVVEHLEKVLDAVISMLFYK